MSFVAETLPLTISHPDVRLDPLRGDGPPYAPFKHGEGVGLTVGALCIGLGIGAALFFGFGRYATWVAVSFGVAAYGYALYLAGLSMLDVIASRSPRSIALLCLHMAAMIAWPYLITLAAHEGWRVWLGLPMALVALGVFLVATKAPVRATYRASGQLALIAALGFYQVMWIELGA